MLSASKLQLIDDSLVLSEVLIAIVLCVSSGIILCYTILQLEEQT